MRRRLLSVLVCLCMLLTLMPSVVLAGETGATVTGASGEVSAADGVWTLSGGAYTVTGTATDSQAIVLTGDVTLTMNSAVLKHTTADTLKYAPAIYVKSGSAKLVLQGENSVEGSSGYAGIAVAPGASLTISGEGSLQATGGAGSDTIRDVGKKVDFGFDSSITSVYYGGGAGIGGNGIWMSGADHIIGDSTADCGTIAITSGTVTATGGKANSMNADGGAGIGGGRSNDFDCGFAKIAITGTARVRAYAGAKAQAIGVGTYYDTEAEFANKLELASTADIWMFTKDNTHGAFWGQNEDGTLSEDVTATNANLVWYTGETTPAAETETAVTTKDAGLTWQHTADRKVQVLKGDKVAAEETYREGYTLGNWAALYTIPQVTVTYKHDADDENPTTETVDPGTSVTVKDAPTKEGYVFTGWSDGENRYLPGATLTPEADLTLTAQWQAIDSWSQEPSDDGDGKLAVDVDVQVKVVASTGAAAEVKDSDKAALAQQARQLLRDVLTGKTPDGLTDEEAAQLRQLLGSGASLVKAKITLTVTLTGDLTDEQAKALEGTKTADESAQVWELTISLGVTAKEGEEVLGSVEKIALHKTDAPISITLKTGLDLDEQDVRVLYLHDDAVKTASASVQDAANGVVALQASEFSPYIILYKAKPWDIGYRDCPKDETCPIWPFTDATTTAWYHDGVHFCLENGLMVGYGQNIFAPQDATTRAMVTAMLWRLNGSPAAGNAAGFADVAADTWYHDAIVWAKSVGVVAGYDADTFRPNDVVTREQMMAIFYRYAKYTGCDVSTGSDAGLGAFEDNGRISAYAVEAMRWAYGCGLLAGDLQGDKVLLDPRGSTTRAQVATFMMRFCAEIEK